MSNDEKGDFGDDFTTDEGDVALARFRCIICGKTYVRELSLYAHITCHSKDILTCVSSATENDFGYLIHDSQVDSKRYSCISCSYSTDVLKAIKHHIRTHKTAENNYPNSTTNKENRIPDRHSQGNIEGTFKCSECGDVLVDMRHFECHFKRHQDETHECSLCYKKCDNNRYNLTWHVKTHYDLYVVRYECSSCNKIFSLNTGSEQYAAEGDKSDLICDVCSEDITKFGHFGEKSHSDSGENSQPEIKVDDQMVFSEKSDSAQSYECDTCKECFPCKRALLCHLKTHLKVEQRKKKVRQKSAESGTEELERERKSEVKKKKRKLEKPFKCDEENCQYATSQYSLLKTHKFKHNPFFKCVTCQETFSSRVELKNHMSSHGERPFKCDQCNKCYKDKHGLGWHKKVQHDPSRLKFTCEVCGKTYPFDSLLTQHVNLAHAAEKQSVCDICGKNVSRTYLPMHRRTHGEKQYSCEICEKTFLEKSYLKRHKMVHTGEKPYVCSVCGNSFRQHSTLTIHMRTHTGDRPYKCVLCENAYKTHHNLKKHYKRSGHKLV